MNDEPYTAGTQRWIQGKSSTIVNVGPAVLALRIKLGRIGWTSDMKFRCRRDDESSGDFTQVR